MRPDPSELSLDHPVCDLNPLRETHAEAAHWRRYGPLVPVTVMGGVRAWAAVSADAARTVLEAHPDLAKDPAHWGAYRRGEVPADWPLLSLIVADSMLNADGADHLRLRRLVTFAFTPKRVAALAPRVREITRALLDTLESGGTDTAVDLRSRFAHPLPLLVICELFGLSDLAQQGLLREHYETMLSVEASDDARRKAALGQREVLGRLVADHRNDPRDDVTGALIEALDEEGGRLSEKELIDTLEIILLAGHETTVNSLTSTVHALLSHPEQLALVRRGTIGWPAAVEAGLRWNAPLRSVYMRYAVRDTVLHGVTVRRGEPVLVALAAANRERPDEPAPERFDLLAPHGRQLAFGAGPHFCLGAALARLENAVALEELFARFPDLDLAEPESDLVPLVSPAINGLASLPVVLNGGAGAA
ncbi:cytochrome P450 [Streptomyces sp. NPDC001068]|uniref:cytochrome P450 family protein n=1 Tax=Streptomyces sp. NPDC001068 TaxID=3364544 RepID=UPI0036B355BF